MSSPNPHEAQRAREEAERLMRKHGFSYSDFEDDEIRVVDDAVDQHTGDLRRRLAIAVSISRRCHVLVNNRTLQIAFQGRPAIVEDASDLYKSLAADVAHNCEIEPNAPGRHTWRICYWMGFVDAVVERLIDDEARSWSPEKKMKEAAPPPADSPQLVGAQAALERATGEFAEHLGEFANLSVNSTRQEAYERGRNLGSATDIKPRRGTTAPERSLGGRI